MNVAFWHKITEPEPAAKWVLVEQSEHFVMLRKDVPIRNLEELEAIERCGASLVAVDAFAGGVLCVFRKGDAFDLTALLT